MEWLRFGGFAVSFGVKFDDLAALMLFVVSFVGFFIHVFSLGYMRDDPARGRYFAGLSVFMFSMIGIVLADNLFMIFIFWELVGFSSYLLIGHWYERQSAADAAKKAFIVNRVGDFGFLLGIVMCYWLNGTVNLTELARARPPAGSGLQPGDPAAALLRRGRQVGADAAAGLAARRDGGPDAGLRPDPCRHDGGGRHLHALPHPGADGAGGAHGDHVDRHGHRALRRDLRDRAVATSRGCWPTRRSRSSATWSRRSGWGQCAVGLAEHDGPAGTVIQDVILAHGAAAAMFHLTTHAFFKALLFLGSGSVIHACHHEQDIFKMGGLAKKMPWTFVTFTVGVFAIIGMPFFAGFFSKDAILYLAHEKNTRGVLRCSSSRRC